MTDDVNQPSPQKRTLVDRRLGDLLKELQPLDADAGPVRMPQEQVDQLAPAESTLPVSAGILIEPTHPTEDLPVGQDGLLEVPVPEMEHPEVTELPEDGTLVLENEALAPPLGASSEGNGELLTSEKLLADAPAQTLTRQAAVAAPAAVRAAEGVVAIQQDGRSRPGFAHKAWGDFVLLGGLSLLLLVLIAIAGRPLALAYPIPEILQGVRVVLAVFYLLFVPGYFLTAAVFPRREDLDGLERVGLSLGMSVVIIPILALILNQLPYGLTFQSVVWASLGSSLLLLLIALVQRWRLPAETAADSFGRLHPLEWWRQLPRSDRISYLVVVPILLFTFAAAVWAVNSSAQTPATSEFYILGEEGLAQDYPRQGVVGQAQQVTIGINNLEGMDREYFVTAYQDKTLIGSAGPFTLKNGEKLTAPLSFTPVQAGENVRVEILLYQEQGESPYRRLALWMAVSPP